VDEQIELLREMRDLLLLIAEPAIAKRDENLRTALREIVGKSKARAKAIPLFDGTRSQTEICKQSGIDAGELSRLAKSLRENKLLLEKDKLHLSIAIPSNFLET
jgi:hypothetical protein